MVEVLARKKKIWAGHKASVTKTILTVDEVLASEVPNHEKLSMLRMTLNEKLGMVNALDAEVIDLIEDKETLAGEIEWADNFKEGIFDALIKIDRLMKACLGSSATLTYPTEMTVRPSGLHTSRVQLPKLQLRSFDGELTRWTSFWESFEAAVHNNNELSNIEKFNYLNSLRERTAREAVSGLPLTSANYQKAVDTLHKRFGRQRQIIARHMDALLQVDTVTSSQNTRALRKLFDYISSHIRSLDSLGGEVRMWLLI